jgi:hypothetical protein
MTEKRRPCAKCERNRAERFYKSARGRVCLSCQKARSRTSNHAARINKTYGLDASEYAALLAAQDGRCAICRQARSYRLNVDHCHVTGAVRGLLCRLCNGRLLTAARDNPATLRSAADYLENPPALAVIGERIVPELERAPTRRRRRRAA